MIEAPFFLSVEPTGARAFRAGDLGADLGAAKVQAAAAFRERCERGLGTVTVAVLDRGGHLVDVFDGTWLSDQEDLWSEDEAHGRSVRDDDKESDNGRD